jgi:hypothetical protein
MRAWRVTRSIAPSKGSAWSRSAVARAARSAAETRSRAASVLGRLRAQRWPRPAADPPLSEHFIYHPHAPLRIIPGAEARRACGPLRDPCAAIG